MSEVVIIGGGVGGLAAAIRLAVAGRRVTLLEKNESLGGKLNLWEAPHPTRPGMFRFDTGPSLITMPFVFEDLFKAAGERMGDHLTLLPLNPISRFVWGDGQTLTFHSDLDATLDSIRRFAPNDVEGFKKLYANGEKIWRLAGELFLMNSPEQALRGNGGFNPKKALSMLTVPFRIGMFSKFSTLIDRHIKTPRLREVLYQYATYSGASPFKCPATLGVIPYCEMHFGGWYIEGGLYRLAEALSTIARKHHVEIRTGTSVEQIEIDAGRVVAVTTLGGETIRADDVLCNADVVWAYQNLIAEQHRPHYSDAKLAKLEPSGSGMVLLLGIEGAYPQLAHHTKFMPDDYQSDLRAMFDSHTIPSDPCLYVCASTRTDPSQAPEGCENLFVLASAPALDGTLDWATAEQTYRDQIIRTLETRWGLADLLKRIVVEKRYTPQVLADRYNANAGSIYGISSNGLKAAFLRPPNRDKRIAGLYFAGGATHPGGGLPLVTLSGKIAAEMILSRSALTA